MKCKKNTLKILCFLLITLLPLVSCEDDRASSVTGAQSSVTSGGVTFGVQVDKTKMGLSDTLTITLRASCSTACFVGENNWNFYYSTNGKLSPTSNTESFSLDAGESESSISITFSGITASSAGTAVISGTFNGSLTATTEVTIE